MHSTHSSNFHPNAACRTSCMEAMPCLLCCCTANAEAHACCTCWILRCRVRLWLVVVRPKRAGILTSRAVQTVCLTASEARLLCSGSSIWPCRPIGKALEWQLPAVGESLGCRSPSICVHGRLCRPEVVLTQQGKSKDMPAGPAMQPAGPGTAHFVHVISLLEVTWPHLAAAAAVWQAAPAVAAAG